MEGILDLGRGSRVSSFEGLHPLDVDKFRRLGELLYEVADSKLSRESLRCPLSV